jgi:diguanylate cyclase
MSDAVLGSSPLEAALPSWRVRVWHLYLVAGAVAIAAYYLLPEAGWAQCVLLNVLNATVALAAGRAAWRSRGWHRTAWSALTVAMLLTLAGNVGYFGYPLVKHQPVPFPSHIDTLLLAAFPFFGLALIALARVHRGRRWRGSRIVTVAVVAVGATLLWQGMVVPTWEVPLPSFARNVSVAYPVLNVVIFALLAWFACRARGRNASSGWLVASYVVMLAGAMEFSAQMDAGTYAYGGPTDALWMVSYLLVGIAALHPTAKAQPVKPGSCDTVL